MRRQDGGAGHGARGPGGTLPGLPSGAGLRPGTLGCPARSSLTARLPARLDANVQHGASEPPKARTGPRPTPSMERREAPCTPVGCTHLLQGRAFSALHLPRLSREEQKAPATGAGTAACPGPVKNAGDGACLGTGGGVFRRIASVPVRNRAIWGFSALHRCLVFGYIRALSRSG